MKAHQLDLIEFLFGAGPSYETSFDVVVSVNLFVSRFITAVKSQHIIAIIHLYATV
jgi:hypothetical protein